MEEFANFGDHSLNGFEVILLFSDLGLKIASPTDVLSGLSSVGGTGTRDEPLRTSAPHSKPATAKRNR